MILSSMGSDSGLRNNIGIYGVVSLVSYSKETKLCLRVLYTRMVHFIDFRQSHTQSRDTIRVCASKYMQPICIYHIRRIIHIDHNFYYRISRFICPQQAIALSVMELDVVFCRMVVLVLSYAGCTSILLITTMHRVHATFFLKRLLTRPHAAQRTPLTCAL